MGKTAFIGGNVADNALSIVGTANTINKNESVLLSDDAKVVGGDNVDTMGTLTKLSEGSKIISGVEVGPNSSYSMTSMDKGTQAILDQALTIVSSNANNMMTLAAGRDANKDLADKSTETGAETTQIKTTLSGLADILSPARIGAVVAIIVLIIFLKKGRKK